MRIIVRADSGYFVGALLDLLDAYGHGYLMCQHFSGHKAKQILAAFRSSLATNSY